MTNPQPDHRHGSPYDRGRADAYYQRTALPHFYTGDTHASPIIKAEEMTIEETADYYRGYAEGIASGDFKKWD